MLVPSVLSALGMGEAEEEAPRVGRGEAVLPIGYAAVKASLAIDPGLLLEAAADGARGRSGLLAKHDTVGADDRGCCTQFWLQLLVARK